MKGKGLFKSLFPFFFTLKEEGRKLYPECLLLYTYWRKFPLFVQLFPPFSHPLELISQSLTEFICFNQILIHSYLIVL